MTTARESVEREPPSPLSLSSTTPSPHPLFYVHDGDRPIRVLPDPLHAQYLHHKADEGGHEEPLDVVRRPGVIPKRVLVIRNTRQPRVSVSVSVSVNERAFCQVGFSVIFISCFRLYAQCACSVYLGAQQPPTHGPLDAWIRGHTRTRGHVDTHVPPDVVSEVLPYLIDLIVGNPPELMKLLFTSPHVPFPVHLWKERGRRRVRITVQPTQYNQHSSTNRVQHFLTGRRDAVSHLRAGR